MPHKRYRYPVIFIELRLERQQRQHQVHGAGDADNTLLAPGPDRRADIVHTGDAGLATALFHTKVEIRGVDADDHVRRCGEQVVHQAGADGEQLPQPPEHFHKAHDRQALHGDQGMKAFGDHFLPTDADKTGVRITFAKGADQAGAKDVTGGFPGHHGDSDRFAADDASAPDNGTVRFTWNHYRTMPRSAIRRDSISGCISASSGQALCSSSSAWLVVRPWR